MERNDIVALMAFVLLFNSCKRDTSFFDIIQNVAVKIPKNGKDV